MVKEIKKEDKFMWAQVKLVIIVSVSVFVPVFVSVSVSVFVSVFISGQEREKADGDGFGESGGESADRGDSVCGRSAGG